MNSQSDSSDDNLPFISSVVDDNLEKLFKKSKKKKMASPFCGSDGVAFNFGSPPNRSSIHSDHAPFSSQKFGSESKSGVASNYRINKLTYQNIEVIEENPSKERSPEKKGPSKRL